MFVNEISLEIKLIVLIESGLWSGLIGRHLDRLAHSYVNSSDCEKLDHFYLFMMVKIVLPIITTSIYIKNNMPLEQMLLFHIHTFFKNENNDADACVFFYFFLIHWKLLILLPIFFRNVSFRCIWLFTILFILNCKRQIDMGHISLSLRYALT